MDTGRAVLRYCAIISDWQGAYDVSHIIIQRIPRLTPQALEQSDKQHVLGQVVGLASDGAAAALFAEKGPSLALDFLEQGQGVIASSLDEMRTDLLKLHEKYPNLAEQFEYLQNELDSLCIKKSVSQE